MGCKNCKKQDKKDINIELITLDGKDKIKIQIKDIDIRNLKHTNKVTNMVDYLTEYRMVVRNHIKLGEFMNENKFQFIINGRKINENDEISSIYSLNGNKLKIKIGY